MNELPTSCFTCENRVTTWKETCENHVPKITELHKQWMCWI